MNKLICLCTMFITVLLCVNFAAAQNLKSVLNAIEKFETDVKVLIDSEKAARTQDIASLKIEIDSIKENPLKGHSEDPFGIESALSELKAIVSHESKKSNEVSINPYGFFKLDLTYDQDCSNKGNYLMWKKLIPENENIDRDFNLTARLTRFGFNLDTEELAVKPIFNFINSGDVKKEQKMMKLQKSGKLSSQTIEMRLKSKDKSIRYFEAKGAGTGFEKLLDQFDDIIHQLDLSGKIKCVRSFCLAEFHNTLLIWGLYV